MKRYINGCFVCERRWSSKTLFTNWLSWKIHDYRCRNDKQQQEEWPEYVDVDNVPETF